MTTRMVALVVGWFEPSWVNDHKLAQLGAGQQMNCRAACSAASHHTDHRIPKPERSV